MMAGDIEVVGEAGAAGTGLTMAERMFPNVASFPGQMSFMPQTLSPKQIVTVARDKVVRSAYQAQRTSEAIRGGREKHTDMVVGAGLFVRPTPDWDLLPMFDKAARKAYSNACRAWFGNWAYDSALTQDAEGANDFGGLMWQAYNDVTGPEADTFGAILRDDERMERLGLTWSTYINVIHPARIQTPPLLAGQEEELGIFKGKQLDPNGAWEGLYVLKKHPSEGGLNFDDYVFVPRRDGNGRPMAWHYFNKTEGGAQRGITPLVNSLSRVFQMDKAYEGAVGSAVLESLFSMFVKSGADPKTVAERLAPNPMYDGKSAFDLRAQFYKDSKIRFGGQRVPVLPDGDELVFSTSGKAPRDPTGLFNIFLREFASATGTTFEQIANNWSDANYSAARAAFEDIWRTVMRKRVRFSHVPTLCYTAVIEEAIERDRIPLPAGAPPFAEFRQAYARCAWMGPGKIQIDPEKEANANETNLRTRATNLDRIWSERGEFYYDGLIQIALEREEMEELEIPINDGMPGQPQAGTVTDKPGDQSGNQRRKSAPAEE